MAVAIDPENGDIVFSGFSEGVGVSPHKGLGNMQNVNLNTSNGEALVSFQRVQDSMTDTSSTGNLSYLSTDHVNLSIAGSNNLFKGNWITVTNSSNTGQLPNGTYYVPLSTGAGFELSNYYNATNYIPVLSNVTALVVGGGGGGGARQTSGSSGGGGAGGYNTSSSLSIRNAQTYTITIGAGGAGAVATGTGGDGTVSSFGSLITAGGGGGGGGTASTAGDVGGVTNGSGGGGSPGNPAGAGGAGAGMGHAGGTGGNTGGSNNDGGGGGGGASAVGGTGGLGTNTGGNGGNGIASSISGASVTYAGGGGGGGASAGTGGTGGGGAGGAPNSNGVSATANTGGGGGGISEHSSGSQTGGNGASGIVIISIPTSAGVTAVGGTHTTSGGNDIWTFTSDGTWVPTIPTTVVPPILTGFTVGLTATIQLTATMGKPIAKATETYFNAGTTYHRYYILDNNNLVWIYDDQNETIYSASDGVSWFLPDYQTSWTTNVTGIAVISGFLVAASKGGLYAKSTVLLGNTNSQTTTWVKFSDDIGLWQGGGTNAAHFCYVGHQGRLYVTDSKYIVSILPDVTIVNISSTSDNVQSFCSWTTGGGDNTQGTASVIAGATYLTSDFGRLPAVFFTPNDGTLPFALTTGTVYYISQDGIYFTVYAAASGGSPLDIETGASGTQYFNSFYPIASASSSTGDTPTYVLTPQRLSLPPFEVAISIAEVDNTILVGCQNNVLYPWNQQDATPSGIISLPESNVVNILTVNQMAYVFAGNKGNIYITDGSVASLVVSIPDYCAGIPGNPSTYVEPYFVWADTMYLRGRVYFSILDQTSTKTGNCGGVWSFVPTQNFYIGQDVGIALRLENQNSYGTYNGAASILIPKVNQAAISPQYFSGWYSDVTTPIYGIDTTGTFPSGTAIIETELIPTGTILGQQKKTFTSEEYKVSSPLLSGESIQLYYRLNLTDAWTSTGTVDGDGSNMSGYWPVNFQNSQWVQFQVQMMPNGTSTFSGNRLTEVRLHPSKYEK